VWNYHHRSGLPIHGSTSSTSSIPTLREDSNVSLLTNIPTKVLSKIIDEFLTANPKDRSWGVNNAKVPFPPLKEYLVKYQNPEAADSIMKIQRELDETKVVLHKTIESVLERGEKIDSLVAKVIFSAFVIYVLA
jgi:hypothetical protein